MKIKIVSILIVTSLIVAGVVSAQTVPPGTGWSTGIQIQNVSSGIAQIVLTGYDATGAATYQDLTTGANTASGASVNYTTFPSGPSSFIGAGVVSADQPIVAIVNANNSASGGFAAGQYQGAAGDVVDTTVMFPLAKNRRGVKSTLHYVQNAGSQAAMIYARFGDGMTWNSGTNVDPGDMVVIDPEVVGTADLTSLVVTSTQNLAGTVLEYRYDETSSTILQATRGFAPSEGSTALLAPIYKYQFGSRTNGIQVQNASSANVDVSVTYAHAPLSAGSGTYTQNALGLPAGASATFYKNSVICSSCSSTSATGTPLAVGSLTAATINATGAVLAIVNESYDPVPSTVVRDAATTYSAISASQAGTKIGIPLAKEEFGGKTTGIQIQNAGTAAVTVKVIYNLNAPAGATCVGVYTLQNITIDPGASTTLYRTNTGSIPSGSSWVGGTAIKTGCFGGATVEVVGTGSVVAVVQEPDIRAASLRQDTKNYEGFKIQ